MQEDMGLFPPEPVRVTRREKIAAALVIGITFGLGALLGGVVSFAPGPEAGFCRSGGRSWLHGKRVAGPYAERCDTSTRFLRLPRLRLPLLDA